MTIATLVTHLCKFICNAWVVNYFVWLKCMHKLHLDKDRNHDILRETPNYVKFPWKACFCERSNFAVNNKVAALCNADTMPRSVMRCKCKLRRNALSCYTQCKWNFCEVFRQNSGETLSRLLSYCRLFSAKLNIPRHCLLFQSKCKLFSVRHKEHSTEYVVRVR